MEILSGKRATLTKNALTILKKRYLVNGESVDDMFHRVAGGNDTFESLMNQLLFLPNSPTLFNAGLANGGTLSACFVFDVDDSLLDGPRSIVATRAKAAAVAKAGGGVGYYFGNIRGKGTEVHSVHRKACGPVAVLRDYHSLRQLITQGGKRDLAQMGVLQVAHPDVKEFIDCKTLDPKAIESFNISVSWTDASITNPTLEESRLWDKQCKAAWTTGDPGMLFFDAINRGNPNAETVGLINATNPCGETPNRSDEPCNLGSIPIQRFVTNQRTIDWDKLTYVVEQSTYFLDDILDRNTFPHPDITAAALATRKLGLGVMGWADCLALLGIHYDSEEAVELAEKVMEFINRAALEASVGLVRIKGHPYEAFCDGTNGPCARNETRTSIAPTGTISLIAGCSSSIEPHYAREWERTTYEGIRMQERIDVWDRLDGFVPKVAAEIDWRWHIRHQAAFQRHVDLGVSKTINLPNSATVDDVSGAYRMMHELGCKGGTVFRDGCRSEQVLVAKDAASRSVYSSSAPAPEPTPRRKLDDLRPGRIKKFRIGRFKAYLIPGEYPDGSLGEIFFKSRAGTSIDGLLDAWAKAVSVALQHGAPLSTLVDLFVGTYFEPSGITSDDDVKLCSSIADFTFRWLNRMYGSKGDDTAPSSGTGMFCPACSKELVRQAGCLSCPDPICAWTRC